MKIKKYLLLGIGMLVLAGCNGESEEANGEAEEGMGTLSAESEEGNGEETSNTTESESESNEESSEEAATHDTGLLDLSDTEVGWLNFEGEVAENSEYLTTSKVDYNPDTVYETNNGSYISYFNGEEFIKTVLQNEPGAIEQVAEADNIRLSFHNSFEDRISLNEK